jgi:hypothetical protein
MNSDGKWGYGLGNGKGLTVRETDATTDVVFDMHPELFFDSYLPMMLAQGRDADVERDGDMCIAS